VNPWIPQPLKPGPKRYTGSLGATMDAVREITANYVAGGFCSAAETALTTAIDATVNDA